MGNAVLPVRIELRIGAVHALHAGAMPMGDTRERIAGLDPHRIGAVVRPPRMVTAMPGTCRLQMALELRGIVVRGLREGSRVVNAHRLSPDDRQAHVGEVTEVGGSC